MVGKATGAGTRSGKPMNAKRLRQAARRMFDTVDRQLADDHEFKMLTREKTGADRETFLSLHDNGDGTWSGKFRIPELHGNLLETVLGHLDQPPSTVPDRRWQGGPRWDRRDRPGVAVLHGDPRSGLCELIEHLPTTGHAPSQTTLLVTLDLDALLTGIGAARLDTGITITAGEARRMACEAGLVAGRVGPPVGPVGPGTEVPTPHPGPTRRAVPAPRQLRRRGL